MEEAKNTVGAKIFITGEEFHLDILPPGGTDRNYTVVSFFAAISKTFAMASR